MSDDVEGVHSTVHLNKLIKRIQVKKAASEPKRYNEKKVQGHTEKLGRPQFPFRNFGILVTLNPLKLNKIVSGFN